MSCRAAPSGAQCSSSFGAVAAARVASPIASLRLGRHVRCRRNGGGRERWVEAQAGPKTPSWLDKALSRGYMDVKELSGVRVVVDAKVEEEVDRELQNPDLSPQERAKVQAKARPRVEYLVEWADGSEATWEPASNLSKDLLRDFESKWWRACRTGDAQTIEKMLATGGTLLGNSMDENRRAAMHFTAATNNLKCTELLVQCGAEVDIADKDGYTPLHMAAGYLHVDMVKLLLRYGADPEQPDAKGRSPLELVEDLRRQYEVMNSPALLARRMALEEVAKVLTENTYEEIAPAAVLEARTREDGTREFLCQWEDGQEDSWVAEKHVSVDVMNDFDQGLEYAVAEAVLEERTDAEGAREFRVRWADTRAETWIPEMYVSEDMVVMWEAQKAGKDPMAAWRQWMTDRLEQQRLDDERAQLEARASAMNLQQMAQVQQMAQAQQAREMAGVGVGAGAAPSAALEAELGRL